MNRFGCTSGVRWDVHSWMWRRFCEARHTLEACRNS
jgi:hypothetical protein